MTSRLPGTYKFTSFPTTFGAFSVQNLTLSGLTIRAFPTPTTQQALLAAQPNLEGFQYDPDQPTIYKWSFEIQHEFPRNLGLTAGYSGNRGVHLFRVNTSMNTPVGQIRNDRIFIPSNATLLSPGFGPSGRACRM